MGVDQEAGGGERHGVGYALLRVVQPKKPALGRKRRRQRQADLGLDRGLSVDSGRSGADVHMKLGPATMPPTVTHAIVALLEDVPYLQFLLAIMLKPANPSSSLRPEFDPLQSASPLAHVQFELVLLALPQVVVVPASGR